MSDDLREFLFVMAGFGLGAMVAIPLGYLAGWQRRHHGRQLPRWFFPGGGPRIES